jgi:uncharacterized protein
VIQRTHYLAALRDRLTRFPVVSLLGPRQVGKTTLARALAGESPSHFFDLEDVGALARLSDPRGALDRLEGLVILDEAQRRPELFPILRVLADRPASKARFLITGSASAALVRGVSESLAGRVAHVDVSGFDLRETGAESWRTLWLRGGFPRAFLASSDDASREWREEFVRSLLEHDLPQWGVTIPPEALRRFWTMLAHFHGQIWNGAELARSMAVSEPAVRRYLDLLSGAFMVRQLQPWHENIAKRQVRSPKIYLRDSGLLHHLLRTARIEDLEAHPKVGASWEGFALEQTLHLTGAQDAYFWATHGGAELDLLLLRGNRRIGFEFKLSTTPSMTKSMHVATADLGLNHLVVVHPGEESYAWNDHAEAVSIKALPGRIAAIL